jgi:hypothetical protein
MQGNDLQQIICLELALGCLCVKSATSQESKLVVVTVWQSRVPTWAGMCQKTSLVVAERSNCIFHVDLLLLANLLALSCIVSVKSLATKGPGSFNSLLPDGKRVVAVYTTVSVHGKRVVQVHDADMTM